MAEEDARSEEVRVEPKDDTARRWLIRAGALLLAFLLGLLPMWVMKMDTDYDLHEARLELRRQQIHNKLSSAAVYARRGEYETARQNASSFFTEIQAELDNPNSTVFNAAERTQIPSIMESRDDVITLLSRADPAAAERLSDIYVTYRSAMGVQQ